MRPATLLVFASSVVATIGLYQYDDLFARDFDELKADNLFTRDLNGLTANEAYEIGFLHGRDLAEDYSFLIPRAPPQTPPRPAPNSPAGPPPVRQPTAPGNSRPNTPPPPVSGFTLASALQAKTKIEGDIARIEGVLRGAPSPANKKLQETNLEKSKKLLLQVRFDISKVKGLNEEKKMPLEIAEATVRASGARDWHEHMNNRLG